MDRRTFVLGSLGTAAVLAGCGGGKGGSSSSTTPTTAAGAGTTAGGAGKLDKVKAAWIYVGPTNDGGWTTAHEEGRKAAVEAHGSRLETTYKENVPEGPEIAQVIEDLIKDGTNIIFGTSFGFGDAMLAAAHKYPDVKFHHATGYWHDPTPNWSTYYGASEETKFLAGIAAGRATKSGLLGFVVPFLIPEEHRLVSAFTLGARSVRPDAQVKTIEIKSWFDPPKERQAAESLISQGADVIVSGGDSSAPGEAAKAANIPWVGYDSDQSQNFPEIWLTAAIYNWGPYYTNQIQSLLDGTWTKEDYYGNIKDGFTLLAPFGKLVEPATREEIQQRQDEIVAGTYEIFAGPLNDMSGVERVPAGTVMTADELQTMDWMVEGVS